MTAYSNPSVYANDPGLLLYLEQEFARDSQFPFDADSELIAFLDGPMLCVLPVDEVDHVPSRVPEPPSAAVPAEHRHLLSDVAPVTTTADGAASDASRDVDAGTDPGTDPGTDADVETGADADPDAGTGPEPSIDRD